MSEIKLWFSPGACSLAPHILLREIEAPFEAVKTSIPDGAHLTEEFTQLNPKNRVPVLLLDGEVITELPAIATAISNLAPKRSLMGRTDLDMVRVYEWMNWLSGTVHGQGFGGCGVRNVSPAIQRRSTPLGKRPAGPSRIRSA
ncbi:MAG TPA: hypothetical protein VNS34_17770 [Rhizobiaceae bacterium]|nr:hypothetical protein [Rhizobiaceae bacterium]